MLYSTPATQPPILPEVAPAAGDPMIVGLAQDRFFDTPLDVVLRARGITRLILVGWRYDGSVLYTAVGGTIRTYTVVVPDDTTSAAQDYDLALRVVARSQRIKHIPDVLYHWRKLPTSTASGQHSASNSTSLSLRPIG